MTDDDASRPDDQPIEDSEADTEDRARETVEYPLLTPQDEDVASEYTSTDSEENESPAQRRDKGKTPIYTITPTAIQPQAGPSHPRHISHPSRINSPPPPPPPPPKQEAADPAGDEEAPWELDSGRPAQKRPIQFTDPLGRTFLVPWRRAKTWEGMKITIDQAFEKLGGSWSVNVPAGRYELSMQHVSAGDSSANTRVASSGIVMPDFWEDFIQPGMAVFMTMTLGTTPTAPPPPWPPGWQAGPQQRFAPPRATVVSVKQKYRAKTRVNTGRPIKTSR